MKPGKRTPRWLAALVSVAMMAAVMPLSTAMAAETTVDAGRQTASTATVNQDDGTDKDAGQQADAAAQTEPQTKEDAAAETQTAQSIYVGGSNANNTNSGTDSEHPLATLSAAVSAAQDGATIYVMSDLEMHECARFYDKSLTITSGANGPYTLSRSDDFDTMSDTARSWYNPALIEVGNTSEGTVPTHLTLTNIVLDDNSAHEGEYFIQAASQGGGTHFGSMDIDNLAIVQDAMVATYAPSATINLGNGAILKNFGGMSAVRLTSGSHLTMQAGSKIYDDNSFTRAKGTTIAGADKGLYGPAGAIWSQSGNVTIENGASIEGVNGRAIYMDGGAVTVDGTISGIKSNKNAMWQGETGFVIHLRGGAQAEIGPHGVIEMGLPSSPLEPRSKCSRAAS